jgi:hypothetical protein
MDSFLFLKSLICPARSQSYSVTFLEIDNNRQREGNSQQKLQCTDF